MDADTARKTWEVNNGIESTDAIYSYDQADQARQQQAKPWTKDPAHFKNVKISALALLKMVMHAHRGGNLEVMGVMLGKIEGRTMIVMDAVALPVEGTETRVSAHDEAYEYLVEFTEKLKQVGRLENVIGWYHSHPGYGCWLSGIDVATQLLQQQHFEPFLAVVIDPTRTASAGKVEIGAFRTYPKNYTPPDEPPSEYQTIPLSKIEDFGIHCKAYYSLDVSYFKSSLDTRMLDLLWNKYWVNTLSSSPHISNREYFASTMADLAEKLEQVEGQISNTGGRHGSFLAPAKKGKDSLTKITRDCSKNSIENVHQMMNQVIKDTVFNKDL